MVGKLFGTLGILFFLAILLLIGAVGGYCVRQQEMAPTPMEIYEYNKDWQFAIAKYRTRTGKSYKEAVEALSEGRMTVAINDHGNAVMTTTEAASKMRRR